MLTVEQINEHIEALLASANVGTDPQSRITIALEKYAYLSGAQWANEQNAAEIAELIDLLGEAHAWSPAGSGNIPAWLETRVKVRKTLEKHGK